MKKWKSILGVVCVLAGVVTAQAQSWLTNGLVAYYPFNGNANNEAGASYNGTPNGAQLTTDRFGKPNKSYQFNGVGDYIYVGNNLPDSQEFSLSVWVNIDSDKYSGIFYEAAFFTPGRDTILETWPGTELRGTATKIASPGPGSLNAPGVLQIGVWKHIVWTLRTNGTALYVNGVAMATSTNAANNVAYHSPMYIGAENHGLGVEYFFHGKLDDMRIYNRALSTNDVAQLYAYESGSSSPTFTNGLVAYYPFNGNANDETGSGNSGNLVGANLTMDRFGHTDAALFFDGVNDYADFSISNLPTAAQPRTLSLWMRSDFSGQRGWNEHFAGYGRVPTLHAFGFVIGSDSNAGHNGRLIGYLGYDDTYTPFFVTTGVWNFIVHTYDGEISRVYVNGNLVGQEARIAATEAGTPFSLGARYAPESGQTYVDFFKGAIDDVRIYNRALSSNEVAQLCAQESVSPGLVYDDFSLTSVDTNKWEIRKTFSDSDVFVSSGNLVELNRGKLLKVGAAPTNLVISTRFKFAGNQNDVFRIVWRSNGDDSNVQNGARELLNGLRLSFQRPHSENGFVGSIGFDWINHPFAGGVIGTVQTNLLANTYYDVRIEDDGSQINIFFGSDPTPMFTGVFSPRYGDRLAFYNREGSGGGSSISAGSRVEFDYIGIQDVAQTVLPPSIATQPQAISTIGGSATNFSVVATGSAPLKYQWIKDGAVLPGATNASLVFSNLQLFNTGNYSVIITNLTGSVTSSIATLTVSEWVVSTLAGSGVVGLSNGPALQASFNGIDELKVLPNGSMDVLVVDAGNNNVRSISGGLNPEVNVYAGSQNGSAGTALGSPQAVRFNLPLSVAIGPLGEVYVADTFNYRIVKLAAGTASVLAGSGVAGITDGTGTEASFDFPNDLAVDSAGNVFVSEFNHHVIRKITPSGVVTRFAGDGTAGHQDGEGFQARFNKPGALAIDLNDNLYVGEYVGNRVRKITPAGFVTTVAGSGVTGYADGMGTNAQFNTIASVCLDNEGNLYVGDLNRVIRRITPSGLVQTIAGQGGIGFADGLGRSALFRSPSGMGWHPDGSLLVADDSGSERIRRVAKVTGPVAPSLVQQPVSVVTAAGGTVVFKTAATGSWPLSYQWQKDGVNLPGENGPSLLLSNVQPTRIGDYAVIVANGSGSVTSSVASLSIPGVNSGLWQGLVAYYPFNGNANDESGFGNHFNGNPPFSSDRFYQATAAADYNSVSPFSSSSFSLGASGFSVGMWVRIDRPPSQYGERTLIHGSWNYGASDPRTGLFSIAFWDNLRGAISIVDGSNTAREITTATGTFPLNKWFSLICTSDKTNLHMYMNGQLIGSLASTLGNKMSSLSLGGDSSYYFSSGMLDDIRIYNRALSSNEVAQLYALEAPVPPTFTLQPQSVTAVAGSFTSLSVTATGSDALRYQWLKDGVALPGATNATLVFSNLQPANVGDYLAVVSNGGGSVTSSVASLIIPGVNSGLWQGLVAYYPFNGNANDESGFGNDGLVEGASLITNRLGQLNSAYKFNVLGDKITTTSANGFPAGMDDCTVSMWVNTTWDSGTHQVLLCNSGLEQFQIHLGSLQNSETQIGAQAGGTGEGYYTPIIPWSLNQWYHIQVVRLNRTNVLIYRNGIQLSQQNSTVGNEAPTNQRNLIFGYRPYAPHPAQHYGGLDDIRIYNRALSSNEIAQLYASEFPDADKDGLSDYEEINVLHTNPNKRDTDDDGLSDYEEVHARLTNPTVADTDGDGFNDYAEVYTAHDPLLNTDYPAANLSAFTAIELEFVTKVGTTYQLQTSPDLVTWTNFDSAIIGDGNIWKKTYSTRAQPRLYHRVESVP